MTVNGIAGPNRQVIVDTLEIDMDRATLQSKGLAMHLRMSQKHVLLMAFVPLLLMLSQPVEAEQPDQITQAAPQNCQGGGPRYTEANELYRQAQHYAAHADAQSVDYFFACAVLTWEDLTEGLANDPPRLWHGNLQLYNSAVTACLVYGQRFGRLDFVNGLHVNIDGQELVVPIVTHGILWQLEQIDCILQAHTCFENPNFAPTVRFGLGASFIGIHCRRQSVPGEDLYLAKHPFAITGIIRPSKDASVQGWTIELSSPVSTLTTTVIGHELNLSRNIAAAVDYAMRELEADANPLQAFFNPQIDTNHEGMLALQPYQPGKIPLVLVHGLISNPSTWGTVINEIMNQPELMEKYQIWAYLYPTGVPFLLSAANLRRDLRNTLAFLDPQNEDPALQHMMLIGHSMGGLLSRLQVVHSGYILWNIFASAPLSAFNADAHTKQKLASWFFFEPQPFVKRVIFIAVPHRGSGMSSRVIGCIGRLLAGQLTETSEEWDTVRRLNKQYLRPGVPRRLPSSVAGLSPKSLGLHGLSQLPFACDVHLHSIIGTKGCKLSPPGDGVVSVKSARVANVDSELFVEGTHTSIKEQPATLNEIRRILYLHWSESVQQMTTPPIDDSEPPPPSVIAPAPEPVPVPSPRATAS